MSDRDYFPKRRATKPRPDAPTFVQAVMTVVLDVQLLARPQEPSPQTKETK